MLARSTGDGDKKKADVDDAKADDRALSPPTKPAQKRGKTARKKPAPAATNDDAAP